MVDDIAEARPSAVWAEILISTTSFKPGFRKITYFLFVNAINGVAWWMHQTLGPGQEFETLAYFGPWDIRYTLLLLGAIKAGYKVSNLFRRAPLWPFVLGILLKRRTRADGIPLTRIQHCRTSCPSRRATLQTRTCAVGEPRNHAGVPRSSSVQTGDCPGD